MGLTTLTNPPTRTLAGPKTRRRAIIYIRVSQEKEEGYSPEQQLWACQQYAASYGIEIIGKPVEDLDLSGRDFAKRKIKNIIERIRDGEADCVIVWQWSRFGRNNEKSQAYLGELKRAGGELYSATEHFDVSTPSGEFSRDQLLLIADYQSKMIGQNWKENHARRLRNKRPHSGAPRFGYIRCPDCKRNPDNKYSYLRCPSCLGVLVVDPVRGPALKLAYALWLTGTPMSRIARKMAQEGVRSLKGTEMDATSWYRVLDSGFAAGLLRSRSVPENKERGVTYPSDKPNTYDLWFPGLQYPLISLLDWERYKRRRITPETTEVRITDPQYALSGLVRCGYVRGDGQECGAIMTATTTKYKSRYGTYTTKIFRCSRYIKFKTCKSVSVTIAKAEKAAFDWVVAEAKHANQGEVVMRRAAKEQKVTSSVGSLTKEIEDIRGKLSRALDHLLAEVISREDYLNKKEELEATLEVKEERLQLLREEAAESSALGPESFMQLVDLWPKLEEYEKRAGLKRVIDHVKVIPTEGKAPNNLVVVPRWGAQAAISVTAA